MLLASTPLQAAVLDAVSKWAPIVISLGGVLLTFLGFRINRANRKDTEKALEDAQRAKYKQVRGQEIQAAIEEFAARLNTRMEERSRVNASFQFKVVIVLFALIAGMGGYLWLTTKRLESTIQHDQLEGAITKVLPGLIQKTSRPGPSVGAGTDGKATPSKGKAKKRKPAQATEGAGIYNRPVLKAGNMILKLN